MTEMFSRAIQDRRAYAQDTQPTDNRDGILWVDTSVPERPLSVYSTDSAQWEAVSPETVTKGPEPPVAPSLGDLWVDTDSTPIRVSTWDGSAWVQQANASELYSDTQAIGAVSSDSMYWTRDGSLSVTDAADLSYTMNDSYDLVKILVHNLECPTGSGFNGMYMRVNGIDTLSYHGFYGDGTGYSNATYWNLRDSDGNATGNASGEIRVSGRWDTAPTLTVGLGVSAGNASTPAYSGGMEPGEASPLSSFRIFYQDGNLKGDIEVFGRDLP